MGAHYSSDVNWGGVRDQIQIDDDLGGMFGNAYTYDDTLEQTFPADGNLRIVSDRGGDQRAAQRWRLHQGCGSQEAVREQSE